MTSSSEVPQVLVIDDAAAPLDEFVRTLEREHNIQTTIAREVTDIEAHFDGIDCIAIGPRLAEDGIAAVERIRMARSDVPIVFLYAAEATAADAIRAGADHCLRYSTRQVAVQAAQVAAVLREKRQRREADPSPTEEGIVFIRSVIDALDDVFFVFDLDGKFVEWNATLTDVTGYTDAEVAAMAPTDFVAEDDAESVAAAIDRALANGRASVNASLVTKAGEHISYEFTGTLLEDDTGDTLGICGIGRDVTNRNRRERELGRYRRMVETMGDGMYALDADGHFEMVNGAFASMTGYSCEELVDEHVSLVTDREDVKNGRRVIRSLLENDEKRVKTYEITLETVAGERYPCEISLTLLSNDTGVFSGTVGVVRDITERTERNRELERYETIVETAPVGVFVLDEAATIVGGNENAWSIVGHTADELVGEPFLTLVEEDVINEAVVEEYVEIICDLLSAENDRETGTIEAEITPPDSEPRTYLAHISLLPYEEEFQGTVGVFQDVTDRKNRERALEHQAERLQTTNRINEIIRDVNQALVRASTREEIEQAVCTNLAGEDAYRFAWIGKRRIAGEGVEPREHAGVEDGYLDDRPDPGEGREDHVTAVTAIEAGEMQVAQSIADDPAFAPWREAALERGYESAAAIPLVYEGTTYGVLCVYSPRPNAFDKTEREVLAELGETIAYAFSAAERRRALVSDAVVELEFTLQDRSIFTVDLTARTDCRVTLDGIVERSDGSHVEFVTITGTAPETVLDLAGEREDIEATLVGKHDDESVFQFVSEEMSSTTSLAEQGGVIREGSAADGEGRLVFEFPQDADVRAIVEAMTDQYADTELVAQRERERTSTRGAEFQTAFDDALTDRQEEVLKTAYFSDFFEWPRSITGDKIADSLDIAGPTFHEHIRASQRKLLESYYESASISRS
jgi:PAS domain S-box-containing protein